MAQHVPVKTAAESHVLRCMEIWSGSNSIENGISSPGMDVWIYSQPYHGQTSGGDVHYLSLCVGGIVTRLVLADVAGHGELVASTSTALRKLLRRYMNVKQQDRLVAELNGEFTRSASEGRFATAVIATFLSHKRKLLLTNAGHPRPLIYRSACREWTYLDDSMLKYPSAEGNFPLGIVDDSSYQHFEIDIEADDWLLLYTDAVTEAANESDLQLGERGLLEFVNHLDVCGSPAELGGSLLSEVADFSETLDSDDVTIICLKFNGRYRRPGVLEKLKGYAKLIGGS